MQSPPFLIDTFICTFGLQTCGPKIFVPNNSTNLFQNKHDHAMNYSTKEDDFQWAWDNGLYVEQDTVRDWLLDDDKTYQLLLLDVRDEDRIGGHPITSHHCPASTFDAESIITNMLIPLLQKKTTSNHPTPVVVVLFCMESARRGPRCARRLVTKLHQQQGKMGPSVSVHVMKGGADRWIRRFITENPSLVEDFDNEYWGWLPEDGPSADSNNPPGNKLYTRPKDQPATPWSGSGTNTSG